MAGKGAAKIVQKAVICRTCKAKFNVGQSDSTQYCEDCVHNINPQSEPPQSDATPVWVAQMAGVMSALTAELAASRHEREAARAQSADLAHTEPQWAQALVQKVEQMAQAVAPAYTPYVKPKDKKRVLPAVLHSDESESERLPLPEEGESLQDSDSEWILDDSGSVSQGLEALIIAIRQVLKVSEPEQAPVQQRFFTKRLKPGVMFPVSEELDEYFSKAWERPDKKFSVSQKFLASYPFPKDNRKDWESPPVVDSSVSRLSKKMTLPVPGATSLKEGSDRKLETILKNMYVGAGIQLRPIMASVWVNKAVEEWATQLRTGLTEGAAVEDMVRLTDHIREAADYLGDAAREAGLVGSHISAMAVAARRNLWLRQWQADGGSRRGVEALSYNGKMLFGEELDRWISQATGGKSTFLPSATPPPRKTYPTQSFRSFRSSSRYRRGTRGTAISSRGFRGRGRTAAISSTHGGGSNTKPPT